VGELDEEMVYESRVGETFLLGASTWRIMEITFERVVVTPAPGELGKMPFWHGDGPGRPIELGRAVGSLVRELRSGDDDAAATRLHQRCGLDETAAANLLAYLDDQAEATGAVPDDAVIVNESITAGGDLLGFLPVDDPDRYCGTRGGGIGQGLVGGIGASLAHPERPVIVFSGDGSAMYSIQALWTAAHYDMPVVFLILHNREYKILKINMDIYRERFGIPADRPYPHMNLTEPELDFVEMAAGMGVPGRKVEDPAEVEEALREAFATGGPYLLDVIIGGRI